MPQTTQPDLTFLEPTQTWQGVKLFCTTRHGGVGQPPYDTFNLGLGAQDDPATVLENRQRLRQRLPGEPAWLAQVHGARVVDADDRRCIFGQTVGEPLGDATSRPVLARTRWREHFLCCGSTVGAIDPKLLQAGLRCLGTGIVDADVPGEGSGRRRAGSTLRPVL